MITRLWLRLAEKLVPAIIALAIVIAWQADRRDRAQLAAQLASAQQTIAQAPANQKDRDAALNQTLAQLATQKQSAVTPEQILKFLPQALSLPQPVTLQANTPLATSTVRAQHAAPQLGKNSANQESALPSAPSPQQRPLSNPPGPNAVIPSADLRPLYDFALDCQACQAKLGASLADLADERTKTAALTKQRDAAIRAAKGGGALRRIARTAKWFLIGAAAGAVAAHAGH